MLARIVTEAGRHWGDRTAYVAADGWSLSYGELDHTSDEVAVGLAARGVGERDIVSPILPAGPDYVVLYAALAKLGAVIAGVNARLAPAERDRVLAVARPRLVVATPDLAPVDGGDDLLTVEPAAAAATVLRELRTATDSAPEALPDDPDRPVAIVFTSGTTGTPKGAVFGGRQLEFITQVDTGGRWGPGGHTLAGTSFTHLGPTTKLPGVLLRGSTTHFMARWRADEALRLVELHRMAGVGGIPTQLALMLRDPDLAGRDLAALRAVVMGGGPATPALVRACREGFGAAVSVRYSCTEAGVGVGTAFDDPPEDAETTVGRPHPGVDLTIVDDDLRPVPVGETGEVCLRSPAVMSGYWQDPEASAAAFTPDGSVRTGDVGHLDDRGRLHLVGRSREMYVRGGYNVFPVEVETVLVEHPAVAEIAVTTRPDDVMGEIGVAVVVPTHPAAPPTLDELRDHGAATLARHKLPEGLAVVDALPLTAMDKLDRRALADLVATPDDGTDRPSR